MPAVIPIICAGNLSGKGEYLNCNIDWDILLKSSLIYFTIVGLIVIFMYSIDWTVLAIEMCQENRKKKKEAAKRECPPLLNPPNSQDAPEEAHERQGENVSNDKLQGEQEKGITEKGPEFPEEMRQTNYGTITI
ncbi:uncharacterized protein Bfra_009665 [Botrytis fragariae]|uniref:Uncharacterized protein n=1 Tax=Botrytis fragariae TaxID=1964551 RepID=A0A8H6AMP8_9HELO|nr:uncharacterized protein Bfra_009665 [Botrytis fragariae]KAF5870282.1 hypothetical protein Bfra_009665 [Botrytis fragariae]